MDEEWRDIRGYEGRYLISSLGRVYSNSRGRIMSITYDKYGYLQVCLCKTGERKLYRVHRLVAQSFIPNPNNLPEVNHKDENKINNCVSNLEWCTSKYNSNYGTRNIRRVRAQKGQNRPSMKGSKSSVSRKVQCITTGKKFNCIKEASDFYSICRQDISKACKGKLKSAGKHPVTGEKLIWKYIDS